MLVTLLLYF